ncbi:MAG: MGH1-like glycoside hydrolase domain-containing protein, partial [Acidimicrobiales bacterium]
MSGAERARVKQFGKLGYGLRQAGDWYLWGPYVSERQWGTVREDYSENGDAWNYLPHDHARSRAYRWGEDGMAGFSDIEQSMCVALALWNGRDPILKERMFGLTGGQANHGEDVKEYWWYLDALPSHAWNRWRYHYPQHAYPYADLVVENARRGKHDAEYELIDTGVFDGDRYWVVEVDYVKADPSDLLMVVRITNAAPVAEALHVLPTVWFRNTWAWGFDGAPDPPTLSLTPSGTIDIEHPFLGPLELLAGAGPHGDGPMPLFCDNETNNRRLFGTANVSPYPKDGINDHVVHGLDTVNPERRGTKASFWYQVTVAPEDTVELRLRLRPHGYKPARASVALGSDFDRVVAHRHTEADEFYAEMAPEDITEDKALVMRQAFSSLLWSKQFYYYDISRWLEGDPGQPAPPASRLSG